jgi:type II secretory pathway pseudopilin PulG
VNWLPTFWFGYWWPSIKGNAPEDITSLIVVGIVASFVIPAARRWWKRRAAAARAAEQRLHDKLDHVLKQNAHIISTNKNISNVHEDGTDMTRVPEHLL